MKISKKIMMAGMAAFVLGAFMACNGTSGPEPIPPVPGLINPYAGEDKLGIPSENLVYNGDGNGYMPADRSGSVDLSNDGGTFDACIELDGGTLKKVDDEYEEDHFWRMTRGGEDWENACVDITKLYGQGKSFLVKAKVKKDPAYTYNPSRSDVQASYTVYSGALENYALANNKSNWQYDNWPGVESPWGGNMYTEDQADEVAILYGEDVASQLTSNPVTLTNEWTDLCVIVPSTGIEAIISNSGVNEIIVAFCAAEGIGADTDGNFSFLIDDVSIIDLNTEVKRWGATWHAPSADTGDDEGGDDEGGEEGGEGEE